ncbi:MAG TPA: crossover junction endodeoxyribonuclease RuvC [Phycisphaerae bacterium]|nr:crossover junction endodeoxyribonuclease RuvC [Phycisphaerae bacterium]
MGSKITVVCGIDPGLKQTGYGVLRVDEDDDSIAVMDAGVIRGTPNESLALRLAELAAGIDEVLDENDVQVVAVEQVYSHYQRPRTAILMAHARGALLLEAARRNCRVIHLPATSVKRHLTGNGRATKEQMQRAVADLLSLGQAPEPPDVADALAVALCAVGVMQQRARQTWGNDNLMTH